MNQLNDSILYRFVTILHQRQGVVQHRGRLKAMTILLEGLLWLRVATLSGIGRGVALADTEHQVTFVSQLKRAHRLMKNEQWDQWETAAALFGYMTQALARVVIAVDWTQVGRFRVLEASLVVQGRGIPFYSLAVHQEELKGRQTTLELTMWYALMAMRQEGQTVLVVADRGFAKFDWLGPCPHYPWMHLVIRLKANTILTWGTVSGPLGQWPLWVGEVVQIEEAILGVDRQVVSGLCLAHLPEQEGQPMYLACVPEDCPIAVPVYGQRAWVEEQNRDLKSSFQMHRLHLRSADRLQRMWVLVGVAFYVSYCQAAVQDTAFAHRLSRPYKDGRKDLSWLSLAQYAQRCGQGQLCFVPVTAQ